MTTTSISTFVADTFDLDRLIAAKADTTVSVCLPARNEEPTVGAIVATIHDRLVSGCALVDEIVVVDDHSEDRTADVASEAGAKVLRAEEILPEYGEGHGKGEAMWKSLFASSGDVVLWCDADIRNFDVHFVTGLLGPLLLHPEVVFVKGFYHRPLEGSTDRGGRVTELLARPVLSLLFPGLATVVQPLAGEYGGRRSALEQVPFVRGYGVDIALLIDIADRFGVQALAQVDLGVRIHRNRPLDELSPQATAVLQAALRRADPELVSACAALVRPEGTVVHIDGSERPALLDVPSYRNRP
ncbi:MAG: glucosyl-3-phosphoglycerate synthase [Acidimicrobiales bacterium]|jgi:glucosyl-3-phosphoglycerate synthase|nr:glucosyl-3-phosphoglycerate synthase [Acidimicrobiales bacterium]